MVDDKKVKAVNDMQPPTDVLGVKRLCGMVKYMAKFLPDLSTIPEPIGELNRKEKAWHWSEDCEAAFQKMKKIADRNPSTSLFGSWKASSSTGGQ